MPKNVSIHRHIDVAEMDVTTHAAVTPLHRPLELVQAIAKDAVRARHVSWELMKRDLRSQYRSSISGFLVPILPALATAAWAVLFRDAHLINVGTIGMPYPFFVLFGMMLWAAFLESMEGPISGLVAEQGLVSKSSIPPEAVTVARFGQVLVNFGVKAVLIVFGAIVYHVPVARTVVLAPIGVFLIMLLGTAIGLVLAPLNLLYTDISKALPVITTFWFFTTPVIFTVPHQGWSELVMNHLNPVTPLLTTTRELAFGGGFSMIDSVVIAAFGTLCLFILGAIFYRLAMAVVIDRVNA